MDVVLLKEVILYEPYQYKMRTKESGNAWKAIADTLSNCQPIFTHVWLDPRSCRERFNLMKSKREMELKREEKASGISPEDIEKNRALDELIERIREFGELTLAKTETDAAIDKKAGEDIRLQAMESLGESRKRKEEYDEAKPSKERRSSSSDTLPYLKEVAEQKEKNAEMEAQYKKERLEMEKEKIWKDHELRQEEIRTQNEYNVMMLNNMKEERQASQQQTNQLMAMFGAIIQSFQRNNSNN